MLGTGAAVQPVVAATAKQVTVDRSKLPVINVVVGAQIDLADDIAVILKDIIAFAEINVPVHQAVILDEDTGEEAVGIGIRRASLIA